MHTETEMAVLVVAHLRDVQMGADIAEYLERIDATLAPHGGRFLVHGGRTDVLEGSWAGDLIILQFPTRSAAIAWYRSPAYQEILPLRTRNAHGDVVIVATVPADHRATDILEAIPESQVNGSGSRRQHIAG